MTQKVADLRHQRAAAFDAFKALADKPTLSADERTDYDAKKRAVQDLDDQITRVLEAQAMSVATAPSSELPGEPDEEERADRDFRRRQAEALALAAP